MDDFNMTRYTNRLTQKDGIFYSGDKSDISYPADGNDICFGLEDDSFWFKHRNNCIVSLVKRFAGGRLIFDIGGGNGFVSKGLRDSGILTCLVEPNVQGCLNAKKRGIGMQDGGGGIVCSDLRGAGFEAGTIPAAGLFDVIEHIEDDVFFLRYINSLLTQDGYIFITVPAYKTLWSDEDVEAGHFRRYTLRGLTGKLKDAGFETVYATYFFSFLVLPIFVFRALPALLRIVRNGAQKARGEHHVNEQSITNKVLGRFLSLELKRIEKLQTIPFGGSCLVAAKRR